MVGAQNLEVKKLRRLLTRYDQYRETPPVFQSFSSSLVNLVSFVETTLDAYESYKTIKTERVAVENERLQKETGGRVAIGTVLPGIVDEYFVPRLLALSQLGAWGLLEEYLRDVLKVGIASGVSAGKPRQGKLSGITKVRMDIRGLAEFVADSPRQSVNDLVRMFKELLNVDLAKNEHYKVLTGKRSERNKLAHTGQVLGYHSLPASFLESSPEPATKDLIKGIEEKLSEVPEKKMRIKPVEIDFTTIGASQEVIEANRELEHDLCSTIFHMWKLGDSVRHEVFKLSRV